MSQEGAWGVGLQSTRLDLLEAIFFHLDAEVEVVNY